MTQTGESNTHNFALRKAREDQGLKPKEVAKKLGVLTCTYLRWERNVQQPSLKHIGKLCKLFNKSIEELGYGNIYD